MIDDAIQQRIDDIRRDLDMVVYKLELPTETDPTSWKKERDAIRNELEKLRDRLEDLI